MMTIRTLFLVVYPLALKTTRVHVAFFRFYSLRPKFNQLWELTLGVSYFHVWPFSTERLSWIQSEHRNNVVFNTTLMRCFYISIRLLFPINKEDLPTRGLPNVRLLCFNLNNRTFKCLNRICHSHWCDRGNHQTRVHMLIRTEGHPADCPDVTPLPYQNQHKAKQDPIGCCKLIGHLFWNSRLPLVSVGY